jgi:hypothetical protein
MRWWPLLIVCAACGGPPRQTYSATFTDRSIRIASYAKAFRAAEPSLVRGLESDTRVFARIVPKGMDVAESGEWLNRGFQDPFLFTDRETALTNVRRGYEQIALPHDVALQAEMYIPLAQADDPELRQLRLDQAAFRSMLDAESARLERERTLPKGAADLMRAIAQEWPLSPRPGAMADLESFLAFDFDNLEKSLVLTTSLTGVPPLSEAEREDLREEIAGLAPRIATLPKAAVAMAKMRKVLDAMWVAPYATEDEATMDKGLAVYVGAPVSFDALDGALESATRSFDVQIDAGFSVLGEPEKARVRERAKQILFKAPACLPRIPVHTPLDMAPPDERAWSCMLVHALDDAKTDVDELAADLAFHDAIVVARWAVSTHGPVRSPEAALRRASLRLDLGVAERQHLFRMARARPYRAMAAGVAGWVLVHEGAGRAKDRAHHWRGIGDAPMDVVDQMLTKKPIKE